MENAVYRRTLAVLVLLAVVLRLALIVAYPMSTMAEMKHKLGDEFGYFTFAQNMAYHGEYTGTHGHKAYQPPGYATYLAANLLVYGEARPPIQVTQNLLYIGTVLLMALLVRRWLGERASLWSAGLLFLNPVWFIVPQEAASENVFMPLVVGALILALGLIRRPHAGFAALAGILFGLSGLTRALGLFYALVAAVVIWWWLRPREGSLKAMRLPVLMMFCCGLVVLPWTIRNYRIFHALVPITTNSKMQLWIGNNPQADGAFKWVLPGNLKQLWNEHDTDGSKELAVAVGMWDAGMAYVRENPGKCLALWPKKFVMFWSPHPLKHMGLNADSAYRLYRSAWWVASLLLGLPGLWLIRKSPLGQFIIGVVVLSSFIHMATYVRIEYRQPVDFLFAAPIAASILHLLRRRSPVPIPAPSAPEAEPAAP